MNAALGLPSQGGQDSNLQPAVLETAALPIAPLPYGGLGLHDSPCARTDGHHPLGGPSGHPEASGARLIMADVNRRGFTVRDVRPWVEPAGEHQRGR